MEELGLDIHLIDRTDYRNLYAARSVIEGYNFGRILSKMEKRTLMQAVLDCGRLNGESNNKLERLIDRLQKYGFEEQTVYGIIINLGIHKKLRYFQFNWLFL